MPPQPPVNPLAPCPCGSNQSLANCCLPYIQAQTPAKTAEALMRSRYTAHVLIAENYLWNSWSPEQRLRSSKADIRAWAESCEWLGLQIITTRQGGVDDDEGVVEFVAQFRQNGQIHQHHEVSLFKKNLGQWLYIDHLA